ncbi:MAG: hypothetical protein RLZZ313_1981 [Verrucomicrobiota bacterium]
MVWQVLEQRRLPTDLVRAVSKVPDGGRQELETSWIQSQVDHLGAGRI